MMFFVLIVIAGLTPALGQAANRKFDPVDLFQIREAGTVVWTPDGLYAAVELSRPRRSLDPTVPANEIAALDLASRKLVPITSAAREYVGFFGAAWSGSGSKLAFLSVDEQAFVRLWVWRANAKAPPAIIPGLALRTGLDDPSFAWIDDDRLAVLAWEKEADRFDSVEVRIFGGGRASEQWRQKVFRGGRPAVSVLESRKPKAAAQQPSVRLEAVDLCTGKRQILARGGIRQLKVSGDGQFARFSTEEGERAVNAYLSRSDDIDSLYDAVNWGTRIRTIHVNTGKDAIPSPESFAARPPNIRGADGAQPPRADARRLSASPNRDAILFTANGEDGTRLWLCGGTGKPPGACEELWASNQWMQGIRSGPIERIEYK
ncbi:MAG: hypothetical protein ACKV2U_30470 [Bryobacteraceae bacterium]